MNLKHWYWPLRRITFFVKQRLFALASFLLLDNKTGSRVRIWLLRGLGVRIGKQCFVRGGPHFQEGFDLKIGDGVFINSHCLFDTSARVTLGDGVQISYRVTFVTGNHEIGKPGARSGRNIPAPIVVEEGACIAACVTILPGVVVGRNAVIAAGSVVARDVPPDVMVLGNPARIVRHLSP